MKKIEIFDPAMCCPTGLCGTNINSAKTWGRCAAITLVDGKIVGASQTWKTNIWQVSIWILCQ